MTPEERIDANIDAILRASGSGIDYHTMPRTLEAMRDAMRKIMSDSYIKGTQDNFDALVASGRLNK
jgi:hypothetical protein